MSEVLELKGIVIKFNATPKDYDGEVLFVDHNDPKDVKCLLFKLDEVADKHRTFVVVPDNNFNEIGECLFNDYTMLARMLENHPIMANRTLVGFNVLTRRDKGLYATTLLSYKGENTKPRKRIIFERYVKTCRPEGGTRYVPAARPPENKPEPVNKKNDGSEKGKSKHPFKKNKGNNKQGGYKDTTSSGPTQMAEKLSAALGNSEPTQPARGESPVIQHIDESPFKPVPEPTQPFITDEEHLDSAVVSEISTDVESDGDDLDDQDAEQEEFDQA